MRNWTVKSTLLGLALTTLVATSAAAQTTSGGMRVGAGLSMQFDDGTTGIGVTADVRGDLMPMGASGGLGWVGDFSLHKFDGFTTVGLLGGIGFSGSGGERVSFYGQFLVGLEHCCETNAFAIQPGGGVNINLTPAIDLRVGFDYRSARYNGTWFGTPRLWFGISKVLGGV